MATADQDHGVSTPPKIIHIDMDAFYASVEQRDNPHDRDHDLFWRQNFWPPQRT